MKKLFLFLSLFLAFSTILCQTKQRISKIKCQEYKDVISEKKLTGWCLPGQPIKSCQRVTKSYNCNKFQFSGMITGGVNAKLGEFPHMAAIGWENPEGTIAFACGGSLISERFVITVAHCSVNENDEAPTIVRLGEHNLASDNDGAKHVDCEISQIINHEDYNKETRENDIALIELEEDVIFNHFVRPACLQQNNYGGFGVIATGWGKKSTFGQTSDILQKVGLTVETNAKCKSSHKDFTIFPTQICAGSRIERKDTCDGDSGGPIQIPHRDAICVYNIVGLTSYGTFVCGAKKPAIYTRVASYLDWIEAIVWT